MLKSLDVTITLQDGKKPVYCFDTDFDSHFAQFDLKFTKDDGSIVLAAACTPHVGDAITKELPPATASTPPGRVYVAIKAKTP